MTITVVIGSNKIPSALGQNFSNIKISTSEFVIFLSKKNNAPIMTSPTIFKVFWPPLELLAVRLYDNLFSDDSFID